jgi:hypothetical protein
VIHLIRFFSLELFHRSFLTGKGIAFTNERQNTIIGKIMKTLLKYSIQLTLIFTVGLTAPIPSANAQSASATISGVQDGANFDYTITLYNTDPYNYYDLNGFWYGWTYDGNNLYSSPSSVGNSLGWDNTVSYDYYYYNYSIEWDNSSGYGTALAPGQSATFTFTSPDAPGDITSSPSGESVAYIYGIDGSQGYPGYSTDAFSPTLVNVPEPSTWALLAIGVVALMISTRFLASKACQELF